RGRGLPAGRHPAGAGCLAVGAGDAGRARPGGDLHGRRVPGLLPARRRGRAGPVDGDHVREPSRRGAARRVDPGRGVHRGDRRRVRAHPGRLGAGHLAQGAGRAGRRAGPGGGPDRPLTSTGQLGDGVALDGETLGSGGADVVVAGAAESLVAPLDGDGAGGGVVVLDGVVAGGVLLGGGAGALLCGSLLVGTGVVGSGAAEEVAGEPVPDVEPLGCWLPAGLLPPDALLAAAVLPGEVLPGDVVSGEVVSGDVPPGALVPGEVEPPGEVVPGAVLPGAVLPGEVLPGDVLPGALVPGLPSADMVPACGDAP